MKQNKVNLAFDEDGEEAPSEVAALTVGLKLLEGEYKSESDFDKGMRLFQKLTGQNPLQLNDPQVGLNAVTNRKEYNDEADYKYNDDWD